MMRPGRDILRRRDMFGLIFCLSRHKPLEKIVKVQCRMRDLQEIDEHFSFT